MIQIQGYIQCTTQLVLENYNMIFKYPKATFSFLLLIPIVLLKLA